MGEDGVLSTLNFHKHKISPHLYVKQVQSWRAAVLTCGESLNMGAHTMSGVEWCLAASARVWVPLTAIRAPLARIVFVPMMTLKGKSALNSMFHSKLGKKRFLAWTLPDELEEEFVRTASQPKAGVTGQLDA